MEEDATRTKTRCTEPWLGSLDRLSRSQRELKHPRISEVSVYELGQMNLKRWKWTYLKRLGRRGSQRNPKGIKTSGGNRDKRKKSAIRPNRASILDKDRTAPEKRQGPLEMGQQIEWTQGKRATEPMDLGDDLIYNRLRYLQRFMGKKQTHR